MGKPNYRVVVSFDPQRTVFLARAPELEHLSGEGPSRKDAIAHLEQEIEAQLANMLSHGSTPPKAIDEVDHSGEVNAKVSRGLHRELVYLANSEGVALDQLVSELLAAALAVRQGTRGGQRSQRHAQPAFDHADDIGNRAESHHGGGDRDGNRSDGNRRHFGRGGGHSTQLLDDRANFIEYVRGLEQGGGGRGPGGHQNRGGHGGGGHGGGGHGGGGHGGGGHGGGNNRRRRGGGGPGGPQQHGNRDGGGRHQGGHRGGPQQGRPQQAGQGHGAPHTQQHEGGQHAAAPAAAAPRHGSHDGAE